MIKDLAQPALFSPPPPYGQSLFFSLRTDISGKKALEHLSSGFDPATGILGIGEPLARKFPKQIPGLRTFPALSGSGFSVPSTQKSLWVLLYGSDRSDVFNRSDHLVSSIAPAFLLEDSMETFTYAGGKDLTGYEDGTENPPPRESPSVALVSEGKGMAGSSFAGVQRWVHDLEHFRSLPPKTQDHIIGRKKSSNEEIPDAPASAHVKRSAQESFSPPANMMRRSMPWSRGGKQGLEFVSFARSLDPFDRILRRMVGLEDGISDALFTFSQPVTGGYYWCPPVRENRIDLSWLEG